MIDYESVKKHIRFTVEHYGTKTEGETHRFDLVAAYLTEFVERLIEHNQALDESSKVYNERIPAGFYLSVK